MAEIDTTAVRILSGGLIQNLGPDPAYVGEAVEESTVTSTTGIRISSGEALAVGYSNAALFVVSDGTSDIRFLGRATGIFSI